MLSNNKMNWFCAVLLLACGAAVAWPDITVFNNFGPGSGGFEVYTGWSWMLAGIGSGFDPVQNAQWFSPTDGGPLSDVYLGLRSVIPPYRDGFVKLCVNNDFEPPTDADVIEQWVVPASTIASLPFAGLQGAPLHLVSAVEPTLQAGETYAFWIGFDNNGNAAWAPTIYSDLSARRQRTINPYTADWQWQDLTYDRGGALRVDVLPEPGTLGLLLIGMLPFVRRR
jgi:hypothetical protein